MDFLLLRALKVSARSHSGHRVHASRRLSLPFPTIEGSPPTRFPGQTSATSGCRKFRQPGILLVLTRAVQQPAVMTGSQTPYAGLSNGSSIILGLEQTYRRLSRISLACSHLNRSVDNCIHDSGHSVDDVAIPPIDKGCDWPENNRQEG